MFLIRPAWCLSALYPLALATVVLPVSLGAMEVGHERQDDRDPAGASIARLIQTIDAMQQNLRDQEAAWPTRETDQLREWPAPPRVRELQAACDRLDREKETTLARLEEEASEDVGPILEALAGAKDPAVVEALVRAAVKAGPEDPRTLDVVARLALERSPCPGAILRGLESLESDQAALALLEIGIKERCLAALKAAGKHGDRVVMEQLIDLAEGEDSDLARLCLRAISALEPPASAGKRRLERIALARAEELGPLDTKLRGVLNLTTPSVARQEVERLVASRIEKVRAPELKAALIVYLGLCRNDDYFGFLRSIYETTGAKQVRLAILAAAGNLGTKAGDFLLGELSRPGNGLETRRSCVHSLGAARYKLAAPLLVGLLNDPPLKRDASRALRRISGHDLGDKEASWLRWWRAQPEAGPEAQEVVE